MARDLSEEAFLTETGPCPFSNEVVRFNLRTLVHIGTTLDSPEMAACPVNARGCRIFLHIIHCADDSLMACHRNAGVDAGDARDHYCGSPRTHSIAIDPGVGGLP